jgi:excisionase family DNA binding protein
MLTVPEAARRAQRSPETVQRWIRDGNLRATKVGTQHFVDEQALEAFIAGVHEVLPLPAEWRATFWGGAMPNWVAAIPRSRTE